jgi:hypothetical protein
MGGLKEAEKMEAPFSCLPMGSGSLNSLLKKLGRSLTPLIERKRPDIYELLLSHNLLESDYGIFNLFMSPRGGCGVHHDPNDFFSVVVGISTPKESGFFLCFFFYISFLTLGCRRSSGNCRDRQGLQHQVWGYLYDGF